MKEYFLSLFASPLMCVAQAVGFCAMATAIISYAQKSRHNIMKWQIVLCVLWTLHFILLKNPTGAVINGVQIAKSSVFYLKDSRKWAQWQGWLWVFLILTAVLGLITCENPLGILPVAGTCIASVGQWTKKPLTIRLLTLPGSVSWLIYDSVNKSFAGACNEVFVITTIIIAIITIDMKGKRKNESVTD